MDNPIPQNITKPLIHDPFGMITFGRSWEAGSGYRYGFNSQELDTEIYTNCIVNTASYWTYDPRIGRRWNLDPIYLAYASNYACFLNSPIQYSDQSGKSVDIDKLYEQDSNGEYLHLDRIKEFELFASTTAGKQYILDHAQKGFLLIGVVITDLEIEAKADGAAHKNGVDVTFVVASDIPGDAGAYTSSKFVGGAKSLGNGPVKASSKATGARLSTTFAFPHEPYPTVFNETAEELTMFGVIVIMHEVFLHGELHESRYNNLFDSYIGVNGNDHNLRTYNASTFASSWSTFNEAQIKLINFENIKVEVNETIINEANFKFISNLSIGNRNDYIGREAKDIKNDNKKK